FGELPEIAVAAHQRAHPRIFQLLGTPDVGQPLTLRPEPRRMAPHGGVDVEEGAVGVEYVSRMSHGVSDLNAGAACGQAKETAGLIDVFKLSVDATGQSAFDAAQRRRSVMNLASPAESTTWTYIEGDWYEGNVPVIGPRSHALWLGSSVFDGARWFEGIAPDLDLHCARINESATNLGLKPTVGVEEMVALTWEGIKKFDGKTAIYIRPTYWAEYGGYMGVPANPDSTRFCLCLYESPMLPPSGFSITVSPFRRPTLETMPTNAKAGCLYPNNG